MTRKMDNISRILRDIKDYITPKNADRPIFNTI